MALTKAVEKEIISLTKEDKISFWERTNDINQKNSVRGIRKNIQLLD
jgi:hypothetical protein